MSYLAQVAIDDLAVATLAGPVTPEPSSLFLAGSALTLLSGAALRRRRIRAA